MGGWGEWGNWGMGGSFIIPRIRLLVNVLGAKPCFPLFFMGDGGGGGGGIGDGG